MKIFDEEYPIKPTSNESGIHTDIVLMGLFKAHVALLNSERQAIGSVIM